MAAAAPGASFPMDPQTAENEINQLVLSSDLSKLTSSLIRQHLQQQFGLNFDPYKAKINDMTKRAIEKMQNSKNSSKKDSDSDSDDDVPAPRAKSPSPQRNNADDDSSDSDPGIASTGRGKKKGATKPAKTAEFDDIASGIKFGRRAAANRAMKDIRKGSGYAGRINSQVSKNKDKKKEEGKITRKTKLCWISPELQQITGGSYMRRCDVVKKLWDYIKEKDLLHPKKRQFVVCDEILEPIVKKKTFKAFGMTKHLIKHVINPDEMGPEYVAEAKEELERLVEEYEARKAGREVKKEEESDDNGEDDDNDSDDDDNNGDGGVQVKIEAGDVKEEENEDNGEPVEKKAKIEPKEEPKEEPEESSSESSSSSSSSDSD